MLSRLTFLLTISFITLINAQWYRQELPAVPSPFYSVHFEDDQTGWAAGKYGIILKTTDGGKRWIKQTDSSRTSLSQIFFVDKLNGWAVGYESGTGYSVILKTTNGGENWIKIALTTGPLLSLFFTDSNTGWIVGGPVDRGAMGIVMKTTNGGQSWIQQSGPTGRTYTEVKFIDSQTGWIVDGYGAILKTTNGGENWNMMVSDTLNSYNTLSTVDFVNAQTGWAAGGNGRLYKTVDGGVNWTPRFFDNKIWISSLQFVDEMTGWAAGTDYSTEGGIILKTTDGGNNWYAQAHPSTIGGDLYSIFFISHNKGWAVGNGTILSTSDGGDIYTGTSPINEYSLSQNYPNPFNPATNIKYAIPSELKNEKVLVKLSIFDMLGSEVAVLVNEEKNFGTYDAVWNASGVASGIYYYRLAVGGFVQTRKMVLVK